jgi:hypothetical protein
MIWLWLFWATWDEMTPVTSCALLRESEWLDASDKFDMKYIHAEAGDLHLVNDALDVLLRARCKDQFVSTAHTCTSQVFTYMTDSWTWSTTKDFMIV